jgi:alkanesulfonate monooxygenase SsuD/methylene tetrahydromethanopterin reductase-like flavin-dependent oxidoreductase (luciferase family)
VVIGVPLVAAPTDAQAQYLASSIYQRVLGIVTGQRKSLQPPVENYLESLQPQESAAIADFLGAAAIGGPERIKRQLQHLTDITQADEIMLVCDIFDPALRLQSLDIAASVRPHRTPSIL